jgi:hypothetical protein
MQLVTQFSVFLVNKPGVLARVARQIAASRINILAMTMMDSSEHGVLRLVVERPEILRKAIRELNLPMTEAEVLMVEMPNRPGALAEVCRLLADEHVNINYAYCTTGAKGGKTKGIFKVADVKKAMRLLEPRGKNRKNGDMKHKLRRPAALRS